MGRVGSSNAIGLDRELEGPSRAARIGRPWHFPALDSRAAGVACGCIAVPSPQRRAAQPPAARSCPARNQPITLDAASSEVDYKKTPASSATSSSPRATFKLQADPRRGSDPVDFNNSHWTFRATCASTCRAARQPALGSGRGRVHDNQHRARHGHRQARGVRAAARRHAAVARGHADEIVYDPNDGTRAPVEGRLALGRPQRDPRPAARLQHPRSSTWRRPPRPAATSACTSPSLRRASTRTVPASRNRTPQPMTRLKATGLAKSYKSRQVVRDLSLEVTNGEVVGLLGPNGAGKTTAFYMIVGLVPCDAGRIYLGDTDVTLLPMHRRAQLGARLPAAGSLGLPQALGRGQRAGDPRDARDLERARARASAWRSCSRSCASATCARAWGCRSPAASAGASRSPGRSRPSRASCCSMSPSRASIRSRCSTSSASSASSRSRGIGVLITDHNVRETLGVCSRAYIVNQGTVIASGTAEEILANPQVREVYLGRVVPAVTPRQRESRTHVFN